MAFSGSELDLALVAGPMNFLVRLVDRLAAMWSPLPRDQAFYEPSFHTELAVYVESVVAGRSDFAWTAHFGQPRWP